MIREEMIFVGEDLQSKEAVIRFISDAAKKNSLVDDATALFCSVMDREAQVSTSVGHQFAIPHGKTDTVLAPFIAYIHVKKAFEWDADTKDVVQSIFLIGIPTSKADRMHLKYISEVSKKLINDGFRRQLFNCTERREAFQLLQSIHA